MDQTPAASTPHVVIVGGGFAGLWATRALARDDVRITLIDRRNHHLFQPLLYQVATAGLSAPDIAAPLRHILRGQRNVEVRMGEVAGIDAATRSRHAGRRRHARLTTTCCSPAAPRTPTSAMTTGPGTRPD